MTVGVRASISLTASVDAVYAAATRFPPSDLMHAHWPMPGCIDFKGPGQWSDVSDARRLAMTDGNTLTETLMHLAPGEGYTTRITGFQGWFAKLALYADSEWRFTAQKDKMIVDWHIGFTPARGATGLPLSLTVKPLWPGYMRAGLKRFARRMNAG